MFSTLRHAALAAPFLLAACNGANSEQPAGENDADKPASETAASSNGNDADNGDFTIAETDMVLGDANAPVTIIEYASVTCPGCATFHTTIFPEIKEKYIDSGKAKLVFREFPTPPVEFSYIGSVVARCAGEKAGVETYFVVIDALLKNQRTWIYGEDPRVELLKIASQVGMDETAFDACLKRQDLIDAMNERIETGRTKYNISSTPSFVINGEPTRIRNVEDFSNVLDEALGVDPASDAGNDAENSEEETE